MKATSVIGDLKKLGSPKKAKASARFFKTGAGEYGEGDIFFGVTVPEQRTIAKKYKDLSLQEIAKLFRSKIHECRFTALLILIDQYTRANKPEQKKIADFYLKNTKYINNWDLVDVSAHKILGAYLLSKPRNILYTLAKSENLWERRIAIVSTFAFIYENDFSDAIKISETLLKDEHDLIHKAVGWVLREMGKKSLATEENFLKKYATTMPRTTLRYAIERFPENKRKRYLTLHKKVS